MNWYAVTISTALILFIFLVGFKLIKNKPTREARAVRGRRPGKLDD